ncbi:MAG: class I SAM-dependent methyltransferase [Planctomycetota bacterium]
MEPVAYDTIAQAQRDHFWFRGRRAIFESILKDTFEKSRQSGEKPRILEVGCGPGGMLPLVERFGDVHALDISFESMEQCRDSGYPKVVAGSGLDLPYKDQSFDMVCLFDTIEHIPEDQKVLEEARRILKPGGVVFVSVPAYQFLFSQNDRLVHHQRRYTKAMLRERFAGAGLAPKKLTYFNTFLFPLILPAVMMVKAKEKIVGLPEGQTNLSHSFFKPIHDVFAWFMGSEKHLIRHMEFPFGHSLVGVATA